MKVLLLRIEGIMQSWGSDSRFPTRLTEREPTKSGVLGLVCAALGRSRSEDIRDLASTRMGVRTDFPGVIRRDYQTSLGEIGAIRTVGGGMSRNAVVSDRYYLNEADFLVGLEGEDSMLAEVYRALENPKWHLFLGRKSYPPLKPVWIPDGLRSEDLETALSCYPWPGLLKAVPDPAPSRLKLVVETKEGPELRRDCIESFENRSFSQRRVETRYLTLGEEVPIRSEVQNVSL